jgi:hypothetical protein
MDEQLEIASDTTVHGVANPNMGGGPKGQRQAAADITNQTVFLASHGVTTTNTKFCLTSDDETKNLRVGFLLNSNTEMYNLAYQGIDTVRPDDNGSLCGGGAFETPGYFPGPQNNFWGCTGKENKCGREGVQNVKIHDVRINGYYLNEDYTNAGCHNMDPTADEYGSGCDENAFQNARASQLSIYIAPTDHIGCQNAAGCEVSGIEIYNLYSGVTRADGINLHGQVNGANIYNNFIENTGDDVYALWGEDRYPENVSFYDSVARWPARIRPDTFGSCLSVFGVDNAAFTRMECEAPQPQKSQCYGSTCPQYTNWSMLELHSTFGAKYCMKGTACPKGHSAYLVFNSPQFRFLDGSTGQTVDMPQFNNADPTNDFMWGQENSDPSRTHATMPYWYQDDAGSENPWDIDYEHGEDIVHSS